MSNFQVEKKCGYDGVVVPAAAHIVVCGRISLMLCLLGAFFNNSGDYFQQIALLYPEKSLNGFCLCLQSSWIKSEV
jgi:hypothetical protein